MKLRLVQLWETLRSSYWFVPALMSVTAAILAVLLFLVDQEARERYLPFLSDLYVMDAPGAQAILSTLASSAITVAGVVFSIAMLVLSNASSQFGPRLLPNFMRQGGTQIVFGGFIATFIYAILVLTRVRSTDDGAEIPHLSVSVALVLGVLSFGLLIYFIHRVATFIQAPNIVENVGARLIETFGNLFPEASDPGGRNNPADEERQLPTDFAEHASGIPAPGNGYLDAIELERIRDIAERHNLLVHLLKRPGQFIIEGHVLALASPREAVTEAIVEEIGECFLLGPQRTLIQDAEFAVDQLVEVAVRALSPGINDPFTAVNCIDWLGAALSFLAGRKLTSPLCRGADGRICVVTDPYTYEGILDAAFNQLRQHARKNEAVAIRLLDMIAVLAEAELPEPYRNALARHARLIYKDTLTNLPDASDRADLEERYGKVLQTLPDSGSQAN
ncbi:MULTISPECIES: DUF2254 domain-containing protein [Methylocaldum]|jgi:uncharacterized membrane protein|uniref:DUF2254 domain-containing protein n=1 Tax=unclassified Methylocaldum TaxID=2622260 RepID=UPI00098AD6F7|nr:MULTISPECIES: DUF2254 domain-containing protein [unclassified Methylocaldum]MBP1151615.1 putative membrane protein [Methylocaldum sp. RMAD-M]MDV3241424.1 DUF2254 domain-containing protein [Methylocaldum sp.]MVF21526.1 DUF2254 domain-containing protein [Methylocaldum sp. BRCS4]